MTKRYKVPRILADRQATDELNRPFMWDEVWVTIDFGNLSLSTFPIYETKDGHRVFKGYMTQSEFIQWKKIPAYLEPQQLTPQDVADAQRIVRENMENLGVPLLMLFQYRSCMHVRPQ